MALQTLANWAEIIGGITVVGGVGFAIFQIVHIRARRRDVAAIELARSIQTPEFAGALRRVMSLPIGLGAEELRERPDAEEAALLVSLVLESIGLMLHRRVVPLALVWELVGGIAPTIWDRLRIWAEDVRREQANPKFEEWTEWLALELREYGRARPSPRPPRAVEDPALRPVRAG